MSTRDITQAAPGFVLPYQVPEEGLTTRFVLRSSVPLANQRLRLFNVSKTKKGPPRESQVMEIVLSANNRLVIETSGFGPEAAAKMREKDPQFPEVIKGPGVTAGDLETGLNVAVGLQERSLRLLINGKELTGRTFLAAEPGEELKLTFGFPDAPPGADLLPPVGWSVELPDQEPEKPPVTDPPVIEPPVLTEWQQSIERRLARLEAAAGIVD
ncbi:MAG: hypothetical protein QOH06_876 [Acidobacteriota bacterium]|jgi:hypothetical protein|nr:hypothetical protein [Acidobacteriota bacterium]